jgi:hypothetical protein
LRRVPTLAVALFAALYAVAAWLYPGGTRSEPMRVGFSFVHNYWCDLLDAVAYSGRPNPARPVGLVAMGVLSVGLAVLWWSVPALWCDAPGRAWLVRLSGLASAACLPLVGTAHHDRAIDVAGAFGVVAFVATMSALGRRSGRALTTLAAIALGLSVVNYALWRAHVGLGALPLVQKGAFAAFLGWVVVVARRVEAATA